MWHMYTGFRYIDSVSLLRRKLPQKNKKNKKRSVSQDHWTVQTLCSIAICCLDNVTFP